MKRSERRHLKQNAVAASMAHAGLFFSSRRREFIVGIVFFIAIAAGIGGYFFWQYQNESTAGTILGEAIAITQAPVIPPPEASSVETSTDETVDSTVTDSGILEDSDFPESRESFEQPVGSYSSEREKFEAALPKFVEVAETYPLTSSGVTARYHAAVVLLALDRAEEAGRFYQEVIDQSGDKLYGQMAKLGLADIQIGNGSYDMAIALLEEATALSDANLPLDAVLIRLGRAYQMAGRNTEAVAIFSRIVDEFPGSLYGSDATRELGILSQSSFGSD